MQLCYSFASLDLTLISAYTECWCGRARVAPIMAFCRLQAAPFFKIARCLERHALKNVTFRQKQAFRCLCSSSGGDALATQPLKMHASRNKLLLGMECGPTRILSAKGYSTSHSEDLASPENLSCDFEEVKDLLQKGTAFFVDVREPKELVNDGRIPGAVNIPLNDVSSALELSADKFKEKYGRAKPSPDDPNLIFSCRKGVRATSAMQAAHAKGYHAARFYRGSFCDWVERGGEVLKG